MSPLPGRNLDFAPLCTVVNMSKVPNVSPSTRVPYLGDTALRYAACLYDPRNVFESCSIPEKAEYSQKTKLFSRGSFATGTTGVGFLYAGPTGASDSSVGAYSIATSVGTQATQFGAFTNLTAVQGMNSPYVAADFSGGVNQVKGRVVGWSLYVKYAGTNLNEGGNMVLFEEPQHQSVASFTYNNLLTFDNARRVPVSDEWQNVCWMPVTGAETEFTLTFGGAANPSLCVAIVSAAAAQPFDYEIWEHCEFVSNRARSATLSFNDPIGYAAIDGAGDMFGQLDSHLGMQGFVDAIHAQLLNQSLPSTVRAQDNWVGLLSFLPQLAHLAAPILKGAIAGGARAFTDTYLSSAPSDAPTVQAVRTTGATAPPVPRARIAPRPVLAGRPLRLPGRPKPRRPRKILRRAA